MDYNTAAIAVRDALLADEGRVKSVPHWKKFAAKALGISKLFQSRWEAVLEAGEVLSLFRVDASTYSYPVLRPIVVLPQEESSEDEFDDEFDDEDGDDFNEEVEEQETASPHSLEVPPDFSPPSFMACGHMGWWALPEGGCKACKQHVAPNYTRLKGEYAKPVPKGQRRGPHRSPQGFPGLCTDDEGFYIGGYYNDCRRTGEVRCTEHSK